MGKAGEGGWYVAKSDGGSGRRYVVRVNGNV